MDSVKKMLTGLVMIAAGVFYVTHSHAALGDLMHVGAVQFPNPSVTIRFDTDPKSAAAQRKKAYAEAARQQYWIAVAHLPFPGVGHIRVDGFGHVYVPANHSVPR
jgi:hypothetical protein